MEGFKPVETFEDWYETYGVDSRTGALEYKDIAKCGHELWRKFEFYKREADQRLGNHHKLEAIADNEVVSPKPDLPNISSGETSGLIRRMARNLVQNTPNVEVVSIFDDTSPEGIFVEHVLRSKIIGSDLYSNDMQQNLFASVKTALTLGFDCVVPVLLEDAGRSWYMKYDTIHYRDVFPEPGTKDVREATNIFIRRYLTEGEVFKLIKDEAFGWDHLALRKLLQSRPPAREAQSVDKQTAKHHQTPEGYEIITWYSNSGRHFLTFEARTKMLLRIEKNKHPLKEHPVHFLVLEKDAQQPFGKSQVELIFGRQEFQDLMLNGAMKLWYRNINPSIIGYGAVNSIPNLSPGKYTQISNPNAKIEPFEVNTQTLMQFGTISEQNLGSMVNLIGNADQQMATQAGNGMSATPQGVEAQQQMVDVTTNNYQKAIEGFFSHYCSYALTMYFQELKAVDKVIPTAEARIRLMKSGMAEGRINDKGELDMDFSKLATEYWVRCVPGSLVEMEDEKQLRILNQLFVPLSQAMPAMAAAQDPQALKQASLAMQYIIKKQIELSGSTHANELSGIWSEGDVEGAKAVDDRVAEVNERIGGLDAQTNAELELTAKAIVELQDQQSLIRESLGLIMEKLGVVKTASSAQPNSSETTSGESSETPLTGAAPTLQ
jgi:hypothetical protein